VEKWSVGLVVLLVRHSCTFLVSNAYARVTCVTHPLRAPFHFAHITHSRARNVLSIIVVITMAEVLTRAGAAARVNLLLTQASTLANMVSSEIQPPLHQESNSVEPQSDSCSTSIDDTKSSSTKKRALDNDGSDDGSTNEPSSKRRRVPAVEEKLSLELITGGELKEYA